MEHRIIVKFENAETSSSLNSSLGNMSSNAALTFGLNKALGLGISAWAIGQAKQIGDTLLNDYFKRIGDYAGNDILQNDIDNFRSISGKLFSSLTPVGFLNNFIEQKNWNRKIDKQNDEADYLRQIYLQESLKGGTKL